MANYTYDERRRTPGTRTRSAGNSRRPASNRMDNQRTNRPSQSSARRSTGNNYRTSSSETGRREPSASPSTYQRSRYTSGSSGSTGYRSDSYNPGRSQNSGRKQPASNYRPQSGQYRSAGSPYKKAKDLSRASRSAANYQKTIRKKKKSRKALFIILPILLVILAVGIFFAVQITTTKTYASNLKDDLELILESAKAKDSAAAEEALLKSYEDKEKLVDNLHGSFWSTMSGIDAVERELAAGDQLIGIVTEAQDDMLTPLVALMKEQPLTDLKVGDGGFNVTLINRYLDFAEELMPQLEALVNKVMAVDSESMMGGTIASYKDKIYSYLDAYHEASALLPLLRTVLGNGEDRLYLFAAQNSAEIRASGGFPGSIGKIRIKDGVLTIGDFESVYYVLAMFTSAESDITQDEMSLYGGWVGAPRDACFIPAFDRTAEIWAVAYEDRQREDGAIDRYNDDGTIDRSHHKEEPTVNTNTTPYNEYGYNEEETGPKYVEYVDGVVSLTPAIIQMLLEDVGDIILSDGTVLNSQNATKVLQYDLYHKYYNRDTYSWESWDKSDALFAETAKIAMSEFVSSFEISKFADYYKLFREASNAHILNMWMKDEAEEDIITEAGVSGKLNFDPANPEHGVYFSLADPSKMGWYLDILPELSEPVINEDGSYTYDVTLTLQNVIDDYDVYASDEYITGSYGGSIRGFVHIFAPSGGYISNMEAENDSTYLMESNYKDLDVYYNLDLLIDPGDSEVFHYQVTTSDEIENPMRVVTTPTLTAYR